MLENQIEEITKMTGLIDAKPLISKLNSLGVGDDILFVKNGISLPKSTVVDISALQYELGCLSKVGRKFEVSISGERILINLTTISGSSNFYKSGLVKITPKLQKQITKDWHNYFPSMTQRHTKVLSRRVGPLEISVGYDIPSFANIYRPACYVHNLAKISEHMYAGLKIEPRPARNKSPEVLTWLKHETGHYKQVIEWLKQQSVISLEGPVSLSDIINGYMKHVKEQPYHLSIDRLDGPALIAAWAGKDQIAKDALEWGFSEFIKWPEEVQAQFDGPALWKRNLEKQISDPEELRNIVEQEVIKHKLTKIPYEELLIET